MNKIRVGINGFGRIGRNAARIILNRDDMTLVGINSRSDTSSHAYLLKYDSNYGILNNKITSSHDSISVNGRKITVFNANKPDEIPWKSLKTDVVIDSTGKFRTNQELTGHRKSGVKYVILSAPAKDDIKTLVMGVNEKSFDPAKDFIISNSSCTTNCLTTSLKVLDGELTVKKGFMTTIHSVTDSQNLLDNSHSKEVRLRRSAMASMIPASTGSAKDVGKLFPHLSGKIICQAIRVPLLTVSLINLTVEVEKKTDAPKINSFYLKASQTYLKGILDLARGELVSKDFSGNSHSSIIDSYLTKVVEGHLVNVYAWYDNEWGYTSRLVDMVSFIGRKAHL